MPDSKILCVPIDGNNLTKSAKSTVKTARQIAQSLLRKKRKNLEKARGRLARAGGVPAEALAGARFRQTQGLVGEGLTTPYEVIDFSKINDGFFPMSGFDKINDDFIKEMFGKARKANAAVRIEYINGLSKITSSVANTANGLTPEWLGSTTIQTRTEKDVSGTWLVYKLNTQTNSRVPNMLFMCIRYGNTNADLRSAQTANFSFKKIKPSQPLRFVFSRGNIPSFLGDNAHRYFKLPVGAAGIPPERMINATVAAGILDSGVVSLKTDAQRPYGPDFNAIRPPGTPLDFNYALYAENTSIRKVVVHYNLMLRDSWQAIKDSLQGNDLDKFLHYYPHMSSLDLPSAMFSKSTRTLWARTAATRNEIFEVNPLSYDTRPFNGQPAGHALADPGPFDESRGLLSDGETLVKQSTRPIGKKFDNRVGSVVIFHMDENITNHAGGGLLVGPFNDQSRLELFLNNDLLGIAKLEAVAQLRVLCAKNLMYRPYTDYVTVAAMYRYELGLFLKNSYTDQKNTMLDNLTSQIVNDNIPNQVFQETWGTLAIRTGLGFIYENLQDLPKIFGTDDLPDNADRLLPVLVPSSPTELAAYGDLIDVDLGPADFKNYADPTVPQFRVGEHGMFRSGKIRKIIIHWGGTQRGARIDDGGAIQAMFSRKDHVVSTHFTITHDGLKVRQHADLIMAAYHAAGHNDTSIGIDLPNIGAIRSVYRSNVRSEYVALGYEVINSPLLNGDTLIGLPQAYETMYALITLLVSLNNPPPTLHSDQFDIRNFPMGYFIDTDGTHAIYTNKGIESDDGVGCHMHVATHSKVDGIDGCIYYALRSQLRDTPDQAFRRMKATLSSDVKLDDQGIKYLTLDRS